MTALHLLYEVPQPIVVLARLALGLLLGGLLGRDPHDVGRQHRLAHEAVLAAHDLEGLVVVPLLADELLELVRVELRRGLL